MSNPGRPTSPYEDIIAASKALQDAEVPTENRVMYYWVYLWWRHPIKRFKQIRNLRKLERL